MQADLPVMAFEAVPHGWYVFELEEDDDRTAMRHIVPFYGSSFVQVRPRR